MNAKRHGAAGVVIVPQSEAEGVLAFDAGHGARSGLPVLGAMPDYAAAPPSPTPAVGAMLSAEYTSLAASAPKEAKAQAS